MHVAALYLFKLPPRVNQRKFMARIGDSYRSTTELRKPFAHQVAHGTLGRFGPLYWEHDPDLDIDYHVRHSALPRPGSYRELFSLVSRLHSTLLDRNRPLWEVHLIEGIKDRQFAVYTKAHHALIDGVAGIRLLEGVCTPDPEAESDISPLSLEALERFREQHGLGRKAQDPPSEFELKAMAEFLKAQFETSAHVLGVIKSYAAAWLGMGHGLAVPLAPCSPNRPEHTCFSLAAIHCPVLEHGSCARCQRCGRRNDQRRRAGNVLGCIAALPR